MINSVCLLFNKYLSGISSVGDITVSTSNYVSNKTDTIIDHGLALEFGTTKFGVLSTKHRSNSV